MRPLELLLCTLLISASAFLSSSEVALFSLSKFQLRALKERFSAAHKRIKILIADPSGLLTTILVSSEIINIALSAIIAGAIARSWPREDPAAGVTGVTTFFAWLHRSYFSSMPLWLVQTLCGITVTTPIIILFCELTPKVIGVRANQSLAPLVAAPMTALYILCSPLRWILRMVTHLVNRFIIGNRPPSNHFVPGPLLREAEFMIMMEEGLKEGAINQSELELIRNVLELDDTRVSEITTPLSQVRMLSEKMKISSALNELKQLAFSRIPVFGADPNNIVGVIYAKDILLTRLLRLEEDKGLLSQPISTLMRKPMIISQGTPLNTVFRKMKKNQMHLAVVTNDKEQACGIVTMNDVLSALFEDIIPEAST